MDPDRTRRLPTLQFGLRTIVLIMTICALTSTGYVQLGFGGAVILFVMSFNGAMGARLVYNATTGRDSFPRSGLTLGLFFIAISIGVLIFYCFVQSNASNHV